MVRKHYVDIFSWSDLLRTFCYPVEATKEVVRTLFNFRLIRLAMCSDCHPNAVPFDKQNVHRKFGR